MVSDLLGVGKESARSGRELADVLGCDIRAVTAQIERERRAGKPICAKMNGVNAGYYLAADAEELQDYCGLLYHRGGELFKTRRALLEVLKELQAEEVQEE